MATWHTATSIEVEWPEAARFDDGKLDELLAVARHQVEEFAPALVEPEVIPEGYRLAQSMQARALWQAQNTAPGDTQGGENYTVRVYPMDWTIKNILRPQRGVPAIG
jgi:hypothetical protein